MTPPEFPDLPEPQKLAGDEARSADRYGRIIAIATVLTTLAAALTAFLQASALRVDDEAAVRAERLAAQALGERVRSQASAQVALERFELAEQQRRRAAGARQERFFGGGDDRALAREESRWNRVAAKTDDTSAEIAQKLGLRPITETGPDGPQQDRAFPDNFLARSRQENYRLSALRDAANEEGDRAEQQFTAYAVSLTMFAVAVFLFGYSLTPHGRPRRRLFAGVATGFVAVASLWTLITALDAPDRPPDRAAEHFARGRVAAETGDSDGAIREFSRAIALRPDFPQAYELRSTEHTAKGTSEASASLGAARPEALNASIRDLRRARELGSKDPDVANSLGFDLLVLGLRRNDDELIGESVELFREARRGYRSSPIPDYNLGMAELALGHEGASRAAYRRATDRAIYADPSKKKKRDDIVAEEGFLGGALTDLELLQKYRGKRLGTKIQRAKDSIVAPIMALTSPPSAELGASGTQQERARQVNVTVTDIELNITPAYLEYTIKTPGRFDPAKDRVSVQLYRLDPRLGWAVQEQVSGVVLEDEFLTDVDDKPFMRRSNLALSRPPTCLPEGRYRLELYINGRLGGSTEADLKFGNVQASEFRDIDVAFCHPADWKQSPRRATGLVNGYVAPDRRSGAYIINLNRRVAGGGGGEFTEARAGALMDTALQRFGDLLPGPPRGRFEPSDAAFMGTQGELVRIYDYPGGRAYVGAGATENGQLLVGIVFGPRSYFASEGADRVFFSFSTV